MSDVKPAEVDGGGGGGGGESTTATTTTTQGVTSVLDDLGADSPSVQTGECILFYSYGHFSAIYFKFFYILKICPS